MCLWEYPSDQAATAAPSRTLGSPSITMMQRSRNAETVDFGCRCRRLSPWQLPSVGASTSSSDNAIPPVQSSCLPVCSLLSLTLSTSRVSSPTFPFLFVFLFLSRNLQ
ncbi:hypothetical protein MUK42_36201 [Musa troglodytarum]|uniref:Uncharacterized protein n=1 Tax=Musa troglodytarum TaxID=320322 RepID=A0A9E7HM58_9LILI|nr:hypothetical protein MUK42_36201 [Musa troglodytarum]